MYSPFSPIAFTRPCSTAVAGICAGKHLIPSTAGLPRGCHHFVVWVFVCLFASCCCFCLFSKKLKKKKKEIISKYLCLNNILRLQNPTLELFNACMKIVCSIPNLFSNCLCVITDTKRLNWFWVEHSRF